MMTAVSLSTSCDRKNYAQKDSLCTASPTGDTVVLEYNKPTTFFTSCKNKMPSTLTTIMDSRCPTDVVCIWAGKVSIILNMDNAFSMFLEPGIQKDTVYNNSSYRFTLVDVIPHPVSQPLTSVNEQKAIISITRQ